MIGESRLIKTTGRLWGWAWFVLFNDTWSQWGHSVSCMTILFLDFQITRSNIRPHIKLAFSLVIASGQFNLPQGFVWVCMGKQTHFITPERYWDGMRKRWVRNFRDYIFVQKYIGLLLPGCFIMMLSNLFSQAYYDTKHLII